MPRRAPPPPSDPATGSWQGRSVARRLVSPDGMTVLVGRSAHDNDLLTFKLATGRDFWLHVAGQSGSHVVVLNPDNLDRLPRDTARFAAALAARYSSAKKGGRVAVHMTRCADVGKRRGLAPGKVEIRRFTTVHASPADSEENGST